MNENTMPLKWHKFLIYFSLWVGAILTLGYSAAFFTGSVYGEVGRRFYLVFPVMQWVDIAYGLVLVGISARDSSLPHSGVVHPKSCLYYLR